MTDKLVTAEWLMSIGFEILGTDDWPIYQSPPSMRTGPVCRVFVEPLMGCDGWAIGSNAHAKELIPPPDNKEQCLMLLMGLGIEPNFLQEPTYAQEHP